MLSARGREVPQYVSAIRIPPDISVEGTAPVVLIGPNGVGKTRLGLQVREANKGEAIGAVRHLALGMHIPMQPLDKAAQGLATHMKREAWQPSTEIDALFAKILAEDSAAATAYRDRVRKTGVCEPPGETVSTQLVELWNRLFPKREIDFTGHSPRVTSTRADRPLEYPAGYMSDGERVALFLAGRVLNAAPGVVVVDEPEAHLHSRLAVQFWNALEETRRDCRFVYITHDLSFALSRRDAQFLVVREHGRAELVEIDRELPSDVLESLLGAASLSIHARRILFCEGMEGSLDPKLYRAWFRSGECAVVPVGSCRDVVQCANAFSRSGLIAGVEATGLIDRDCWPREFLDAQEGPTAALPVHEVESLFCLRGVHEAVARHLKRPADASGLIADVARRTFKDEFLNRIVSERFRRRLEHSVATHLGRLRPDADFEMMAANHAEACGPDPHQVTNILEEERGALRSALRDGDEEAVLRLFPGKPLLRHVAAAVGMTADSYTELVCDGLEEADSELGKALENSLADALPPRR